VRKTKVQRIGGWIRKVASVFNWLGTKCETSGKGIETAKGLGDIIATGTEATALDKFAHWLAVDVLGREGCGCPARRNQLNTLWRFGYPKLVIAIPEYNDRGGLWAMLQHLYWEIHQARLNDVVEVAVITQTPTIKAPVREIRHFGTPQETELPPQPTQVIADASPLKTLCDTFTARGVKTTFHQFTDVMGTGPAKRHCVEVAAKLGAEWVWICDSHLHFSPGSVERFYKWVSKTKNRNSKDLYHCPLLYDNFAAAHTGLNTRTTNKLALIGGDNIWGQWQDDSRLYTEDADPIEIKAHGGFWMASRVDIAFATFGHPLFRGFGDPETILHEQRRAAGFKVYCLPARIVSCTHRFLKVRHNDYHSPWTDALRNHWIGVASLRLHFMKEAMAAGFDEPTDWLTASWLEAHPNRKAEILATVAKAAIEWGEFREKQAQQIAEQQRKRQEAQAAKQHAQKFSEIADKQQWGGGETISGPGSSKAATVKISEAIPNLMREIGATSLLDVPCGDGNWMGQILKGNDWIQYHGGDVAQTALEAYRKRAPALKLDCINLMDAKLPKADVVLCRDGLVHMPHADVRTALANIKASGSTWLLATTFPGRKNKDIPLGHWHPMDLADPIFGLGKPEQIINEGCTEGGGQFADKSLGLWRLN
jgi:hypothetical protein